MPRVKDNPIIAKANCFHCDTVVEVLHSLKGRGCAYYYCPNCKGQVKWGKQATQEVFYNDQTQVKNERTENSEYENQDNIGSESGSEQSGIPDAATEQPDASEREGDSSFWDRPII